ncbi:DUF5060 domain-containing protein [Hymenobacter busanensis]|uniref:DUF5060 domain-containing protein n=1 Tax=Hymenobacter busanensis TaxID=2607656 RepID=UPI001366BE90|nr:DUF5060 domain-containing protein [Hymenobacter busanensis]QHJ08804.1 DUF5060 domain-containing protein [Hymenobacter busanensis]
MPQYAKYEAAFALTSSFTNPYDPDEVDVTVVFTSPSRRARTVHGFFMVPYQRHDSTGTWRQRPTAQPWRVRFSPDEAGQWTYTVTIRTGQATSTAGPYRFQCAASAAPGFLRAVPDRSYLQFSNGSSFFGIGQDLRSSFNTSKNCDAQPTACDSACYLFSTLLQQLGWVKSFARSGGNLARVWLEPFSYEPEWEIGGDYGTRQNRLADLDSLVATAGASGVYLHMVLYNSRALAVSKGARTEGSGWQQNPYNRRFGLDSLRAFYIDGRAIRAYQHRLRYIQARWGYSPAIASYGLMNEPELPGEEIQGAYYRNGKYIDAWFVRMAQFLKQDSYPAHLVSVDYGFGFSGGANDSPAIDFTNTHHYTWDKLGNYQRAYIARHHVRRFGKPFVQTEFGTPYWISEDNNEEVRQAAWASAFSGAFSTAFFYGADGKYNNACWGGEGVKLYLPLAVFLRGESFNDSTNLYQPIGSARAAHRATRARGFEKPRTLLEVPDFDQAGFGPAGFFGGEGLRRRVLTRDVVPSTPRIEVFALRSAAKVIGWVHDTDYYWYNLPHNAHPEVHERLKNPRVQGRQPAVSPLSGQTMTLEGLERDGLYRLQWFSTHYNYDTDGVPATTEDGGPIAGSEFQASVTVLKGKATIAIPTLQPRELGKTPYAPDYGFKLTWAGEAATPTR